MTKTKAQNHLIPIFILLALVIILIVLAMIAFRNVPAPTQIPTRSTSEVTGKMIPFNFGAQRVQVDHQTLTFSSGSYAVGDHTATVGERTVNTVGNTAAAILTDQPGGSGTFYYLLGAKQSENGEVYSKPISLGDRIKFESLSVSDDGEIEVTYFVRAANAPMSAKPSKKMTMKYAFQDDGNLISVLH